MLPYDLPVSIQEYPFEVHLQGVRVRRRLVRDLPGDQVLVDKLLSKVRAGGLNRHISYRVTLEEHFLKEQRNHLRRALAASRGETFEPEEEAEDSISSDNPAQQKYHLFQKRRWRSGTASVAVLGILAAAALFETFPVETICLIVIVAALIILYIMFLPTEERNELLNVTEKGSSSREEISENILLLEHPGRMEHLSKEGLNTEFLDSGNPV